MQRPCWISLGLMALALAATPARGEDQAKGLDFFERKIRPILAKHCLECHSAPSGKKGPKGGLRLDHRDAIRKGGDSGPALVPGKPDESLLLEVLRYRDAIQMPPKEKLPDAVVADFETWIKMGAPDPRDLDQRTGQGRSLAEKNSEQARKHWAYQPIRAVPVPQTKDRDWPRNDIDRFVLSRLEAAGLRPGDDASRAVLLRRLSFDLVGLPPTPEQINAFVNDKRPDAVERWVDELLASPAFGERWGRHWLDVARFAESLTLRGMIFKEAWRYRDYVIETFNEDRPIDQFLREQIAGDLMPSDDLSERRRRLVATAYLALGNTNLEEQDKAQLRMDVVDEQLDTIGKGLIAQTLGCARCHDHKFDPIPTRDYYALAGIFRNTRAMEHANVSKWLERPLPMDPESERRVTAAEAEIAHVESRLKQERSKVGAKSALSAKGVLSVAKLPGVVLDDLNAKKVGSWTISKHSGSFIGSGYLHDENGGKGEKTLTFQPENLPPGEYEVRLAYSPGASRCKNVPVTVMSVDGEKSVTINETLDPPIDGRFVSLGRYRFEKGGLAYVLVSNEGTTGHVIADAVQFLPADAATVAGKPDGSATETTIQKLQRELAQLKARAPRREMTVSVFEEKTIEDTKIHVRGNVHSLGDRPVPRGYLECVPVAGAPRPSDRESGRREFAAWLTDPRNPLTSRVYVNRVWHWLFGAGLVRTTDNFGTTGEPPSHPELLDHLALQFQREGWTTKKLVREIVLSHTYQLASDDRAPARATDPENRLLWRANRRRLDAECLRDAMLSVGSGLEVAKGGPTFALDRADDYGFKSTSNRRSVYLPVFRNALPEIFEVFDFADPSVVTGRRHTSTVAPQALFLLNHPFVIEQAKALAARLVADKELQGAARLDRLYLLILGRGPTASEVKVAEAFLTPDRIDTEEHAVASWAMMAQALFASPEFRSVD